MGLLEKLELHYPPRYAPEWGSGGIFGLKYHRGVLYFTVAFEAVAHFVSEEGVMRYRFEQVGPPPASGGDTYNAVDAVDGQIYFGGWVHSPAPAVSKGGQGATLSFVNKYSHLHVYDVGEGTVRLLWKEGLKHETKWVGEVSEVLYDAINDRLLLARGDGMVNLGVYQIDRRGGSYAQLLEGPAFKGTMFYDHACFDVMYDWRRGVEGVQCLDLIEGRVHRLQLDVARGESIDGGSAWWPLSGTVASAYGRLFMFVRGGVFVGDPLDPSSEPMTFVRLLDFVESGYGPRRATVRYVGGGLLVPFNAFTESVRRPADEHEALVRASTATIIGPSVLLYITPPTVKVVAALGARVTGVELVGDKMLLAVNSAANLGRLDATALDSGYRGFVILPQDIVVRPPPPLRFSIPGARVKDRTFGGVPLAGYREPALVVNATKTNRIFVYEYDLALPPEQARAETYSVGPGRNVIELRGFGNSVVSIRFAEPDGEASIKIDLR